MRDAVRRVRGGASLEREEMRDLIRALMTGSADEDAVADLLVALHAKGETVEELVGAALAMRELARPLPEAPASAVDTCGTGGDGAGTFNISTVAALVVAGAGVPVAKHGNRAATSRCGSADLLEGLGVRLELPPERMAQSVDRVGIGFLFARACHPAMARVAPIRARLGTPTVFNRLGPLTNPMRVRRQLVGVAAAAHLAPMREALVQLGARAVWVVHGEDGLDEISPGARTHAAVHGPDGTRELTLAPGEYVPAAPSEALHGGDVAENVRIARALLEGGDGPRRDAVLLNAGAALVIAGCAPDLAAGVEVARSALDLGAARAKLEEWIRFTRGEPAP